MWKLPHTFPPCTESSRVLSVLSGYLSSCITLLLLWQNTRTQATCKRKCKLGLWLQRDPHHESGTREWQEQLRVHIWIHRQEAESILGKGIFEASNPAPSDTSSVKVTPPNPKSCPQRHLFHQGHTSQSFLNSSSNLELSIQTWAYRGSYHFSCHITIAVYLGFYI